MAESRDLGAVAIFSMFVSEPHYWVKKKKLIIVKKKNPPKKSTKRFEYRNAHVKQLI